MGTSSSAGGGGAIYQANKAGLDVAITDLSHSKAIPLNIGESDRFIEVITLAGTVGPYYCPPNRNMIGGELLNIIVRVTEPKLPSI